MSEKAIFYSECLLNAPRWLLLTSGTRGLASGGPPEGLGPLICRARGWESQAHSSMRRGLRKAQRLLLRPNL